MQIPVESKLRLGGIRKLLPITPKGTRTWLIIKPFGRVQVLMGVPIGSAKADTSPLNP